MMFQHRILFMSVWLIGAVALVFFPGWECKGFFLGLGMGTLAFEFSKLGRILSMWPLLNTSKYGLLVLMAVIIALNSLPVGLCAWAMDKARLTKRLWLVLLIALIAGAGIGFWYQHDRFNVFWEMHIHQSERPTEWEFYRAFVIPSMVVLSLWGLYATALIGLIISGAAILFRMVCACSRRGSCAGYEKPLA